MAELGGSDYRSGAHDRIEESRLLMLGNRFGGSVYLAGRAVESILRAIIWAADPDYSTGRKSLETGHDLRAMLKLMRNLGLLGDQEIRDRISGEVQKIARLWSNNMRYYSTTKIAAKWYDLGEIDGKKRTMKLACQDFYRSCAAVIKRCEALWLRIK